MTFHIPFLYQKRSLMSFRMNKTVGEVFGCHETRPTKHIIQQGQFTCMPRIALLQKGLNGQWISWD